MFNENIVVKQQEIKFYEAKTYNVEYYKTKFDEVKFYEIDYIDTKPNEIRSCGVNYINIKPQSIKYHEAKTYNVEYYEVKSDQIKYHKIDYINIKNCETKSYKIEHANDISIKNRFNSLIQANIKDIISIASHINSGFNLKKEHIDLKDIKNKFIAYNDALSFGILSKSSYIDFKEMAIISAKSDAKYAILRSKIMTKSLKILKMPLF